MTIRFKMSTAASALLAATAMGVAGLAAAQTSAGADPVLIAPAPGEAASDDNGVRAAPSGQVSEQALPGSPQTAAARPLQALRPVRRISAAANPTPERLTVQLASADASPAAEPAAANPPATSDLVPGETVHAAPAEAAPAQTLQAQPVVFQGRSTPLTALDTRPAALPTVAETAVREESSDGDVAEPGAEDVASAGPGPEEARAYGLVQTAPAPAATQIADRSYGRPAADEPAPAHGMQQHVSFPRRSVEAAAAFDGYMQSAAGLSAELRGGADVADALKVAAAYEPKQLEEGMIAYGAIAALQDARFVYAVMDAAADDRSRRELADEILQDPRAASRLPGADEAAAAASAAILREVRPVISQGKALRQASYDVQRQPWSTAKAADGAGRLSRAKAESSAPFRAHDGDMARVLTRITTLKDADFARGRSHGEAASRSVALAALAILGGRNEADQGLDRLLSEYSTTECLKMAKLNLFQCLSVAGPEYEDVYCLGKHAVLDTGQCVAAAADSGETMQLSALTSRRESGER